MYIADPSDDICTLPVTPISENAAATITTDPDEQTTRSLMALQQYQADRQTVITCGRQAQASEQFLVVVTLRLVKQKNN